MRNTALFVIVALCVVPVLGFGLLVAAFSAMSGGVTSGVLGVMLLAVGVVVGAGFAVKALLDVRRTPTTQLSHQQPHQPPDLPSPTPTPAAKASNTPGRLLGVVLLTLLGAFLLPLALMGAAIVFSVGKAALDPRALLLPVLAATAIAVFLRLRRR